MFKRSDRTSVPYHHVGNDAMQPQGLETEPAHELECLAPGSSAPIPAPDPIADLGRPFIVGPIQETNLPDDLRCPKPADRERIAVPSTYFAEYPCDELDSGLPPNSGRKRSRDLGVPKNCVEGSSIRTAERPELHASSAEDTVRQRTFGNRVWCLSIVAPTAGRDRKESASPECFLGADHSTSDELSSISRKPFAPFVSTFETKVDANTLRMLQSVPIFSGLNDRQLRSLTRDSQGRAFTDGETVVKQGDKGLGFYLLLEGRVEVRRKGRRLATLGPGEFFGEMALFDEQPRSADVVALQPTRCLVLTKWEFWGFAMNQPRMLRGMLAEMARRLAETNRALSE